MTGETEKVQKNLKEFSDIPDVFLSDYKIENYKKAKKEKNNYNYCAQGKYIKNM